MPVAAGASCVDKFAASLNGAKWDEAVSPIISSEWQIMTRSDIHGMQVQPPSTPEIGPAAVWQVSALPIREADVKSPSVRAPGQEGAHFTTPWGADSYH